MVSKKGQGISLNVIIIAAIALVVMVILIALVLNSASTTTTAVNSCEALGSPAMTPESDGDYRCVEPSEGCGQGWIRNPARGCEGSTDEFPLYCCIPI